MGKRILDLEDFEGRLDVNFGNGKIGMQSCVTAEVFPTLRLGHNRESRQIGSINPCHGELIPYDNLVTLVFRNRESLQAFKENIAELEEYFDIIDNASKMKPKFDKSWRDKPEERKMQEEFGDPFAKTKTSEKRIEKQLQDLVKARGGLCLKLLPFQFTGLPDRLVLLPEGKVVFCETKTTGDGLSPRQKLVHTKLRRLGFRVLVIDNLEKLKEI